MAWGDVEKAPLQKSENWARLMVFGSSVKTVMQSYIEKISNRIKMSVRSVSIIIQLIR